MTEPNRSKDQEQIETYARSFIKGRLAEPDNLELAWPSATVLTVKVSAADWGRAEAALPGVEQSALQHGPMYMVEMATREAVKAITEPANPA